MTQPETTSYPHKKRWAQPVISGLIAAIVGYASSFSIVLQGLAAVGASPYEAASGLFALCIGQGIVAIFLGLRYRQPINIAWSTPGAALLMGNHVPHGGFGVAVTAFMITSLLIVLAGIYKPLRKAIADIPMSIASAMLAGILFQICLAPAHAAAELPAMALPIIIAWIIAWCLIRRYAVLVAFVATVIVILLNHTGSLQGADPFPQVVWVRPVLDLVPAFGIAIPLFIVTMASQNVPGIAVMRNNGYDIPVKASFVSTGVASFIIGLLGGHGINLSAITAALCAGPEAGSDRGRRYFASIASGITYLVLGSVAGSAALFVTLAPPILIQSLAGLALMASLGASLHSALKSEAHQLQAVITFIITASGITVLGIGAAFWGILAGLLLLALDKCFSPKHQI